MTGHQRIRARTSAPTGSLTPAHACTNPRRTRSSGGNVTGCAATHSAITGSYGSSNTTDSFVGKCRKNVICETPAAREIAATVVGSYPSRRNNSDAHRCNAPRVRSARSLIT